jgi:hypothetical protein
MDIRNPAVYIQSYVLLSTGGGCNTDFLEAEVERNLQREIIF